PRLVRLDATKAIFEDGSEEECDFIIYCTGYNISFPFFNSNCNPLRYCSCASADGKCKCDVGLQSGADRTLKLLDPRVSGEWTKCGDRVTLFKRVFLPGYKNLAFIGTKSIASALQ